MASPSRLHRLISWIRMKPSSVDGGRLEYKPTTQAGSELPRHVTICRGSSIFNFLKVGEIMFFLSRQFYGLPEQRAHIYCT